MVQAGLSSTVQAAKYKWKVGTLAPKGVGWAVQVDKILVPHINQATNGELDLKVYWGGVMGDDEDYLRKMRIGQLHAAGLSAQGAVLAVEEFSVTELPFLFNNFDEVDYIREKMASTFDRIAENRGYKLVAWIDQDFDQIYSVKYKMDSLEDFGKARISTWFGPLEENLLESLGANPIPIAVPEIAASVRSGIVDTLISPAIWMVGAQLYSVVKYVNPIKIRYSPALIIVSLDGWNMIPETHQKAMLNQRSELVARFVQAVRKDNEKSLNAMIRYGVREVKMDEKDYATLKSQAVKVYDTMAGKLYEPELLEELQGHLRDYRNQ